MVSIADELLEVLSKYPYKPCLRLIDKNTRCSKTELEVLRKVHAKAYMIDTTQSISKSGQIKPNGVFEIFRKFSMKNPSETRSDMIEWTNDQALKLSSFSLTAFLKTGDSFTDWLHDMKSENTPRDELALYCLSRMYLRHVHVHTKKLYWTTVQYSWGDTE